MVDGSMAGKIVKLQLTSSRQGYRGKLDKGTVTLEKKDNGAVGTFKITFPAMKKGDKDASITVLAHVAKDPGLVVSALVAVGPPDK